MVGSYRFSPTRVPTARFLESSNFEGEFTQLFILENTRKVNRGYVATIGHFGVVDYPLMQLQWFWYCGSWRCTIPGDLGCPTVQVWAVRDLMNGRIGVSAGCNLHQRFEHPESAVCPSHYFASMLRSFCAFRPAALLKVHFCGSCFCTAVMLQH